jgi:F-box-like
MYLFLSPHKAYCRRKKRSNQPLSLSQASNSLLFTTFAARSHRPTGPPPEPIGKKTISTKVVEITPSEVVLRKSKERAGLPDYDLPSPRIPRSRPSSIRSSHRSSIRSGRSRATVHRKQSFETVRSRMSIASSRLSGGFSRLIIEEPASLTNIPMELVHTIARFLPRSDLLNLVCVCQQLRAQITMLLYTRPFFGSTYRFAQFVTSISHNPRLADLVRELDLSGISKLPKRDLAGWREWKYRSESLYSIYPPSPDGDGVEEVSTAKHPLAHPLLKKYSTGGHDIALGAILHVISACTRLRYYYARTLH